MVARVIAATFLRVLVKYSLASFAMTFLISLFVDAKVFLASAAPDLIGWFAILAVVLDETIPVASAPETKEPDPE